MENKPVAKNQILTIPNFLSLFRIVLIPFIVWAYCGLENAYLALGLIILSALTDIVDGFIARKFNMISDFGKILDPIADKLTQGTVIICLTLKYKLMRVLIAFFIIKEIIMGLMGAITLKKKGKVNSAKWYGKANTVVLYAVMMALVLFPNINGTVADILIYICMAVMALALLLYINFYVKIWKGNAENERENQ